MIIVAAGNDGGASRHEGIWSAVVRGKGAKRTRGRSYTLPRAKREPPFTCTISSTDKHTPIPIPSLAELMPSMKISMAHADTTMQPQQYFDPFPALALVRGLLADMLANEIV